MAEDPTPGAPPENLTARTLQGMRWTTAATIAAGFMQLVYAALMGRLLSPEAFGLVAMAGLAYRFGDYFARMGVGEALVQKAELSDQEIRAGFTSNIILGAAFAVLFFVAAPAALWLFDEPEVVEVLRLLSLMFVLQGLGNTSFALLRRHLRFRELSVIEVTTYGFAYFVIGVPLALGGAGVHSLVAAMLSQVALASLLHYARCRHSGRLVFRWEAYRALYGFGARVSLIGFLEFLTRYLDTLMIGRFAGAAPLGHYNRAFMLVHMPLQRLTVSLSRVLFPSMSRVQKEPQRLARAYLSTVGALSVFLFPVCVGIGVAAPELVTVVLGPQWDQTQRVLPIIAVTAAFMLTTHVAAVLCEALGALTKKLALQAVSLAVLVAGLVAAIGEPLEAYALAVLVTEVFRAGLYSLLLRHELGLDLRALARRYLAALLSAGLVAAAVGGTRLAVNAVVDIALLSLLAQVAAGAATLAVTLRLPPLREVRRDLLGRLQAAGIFGIGPGWTTRLLRVALGQDVHRGAQPANPTE